MQYLQNAYNIKIYMLLCIYSIILSSPTQFIVHMAGVMNSHEIYPRHVFKCAIFKKGAIYIYMMMIYSYIHNTGCVTDYIAWTVHAYIYILLKALKLNLIL